MKKSSLYDILGRMPRWAAEVLSHGLLVAIGLVDYATGPELSLSVFFLFPILAATWVLGRTRGLLMSLLSAVAWLLAHAGLAGVVSQPAVIYWNAAVRLGFFVVVTLLAASLRRAMADTEKLATHDFVTGVANARSLFENLRIELERARRYRHPISVAYVDIDNFKEINDRHGHIVGNAVLRDVARTMRSSLRSSDVVARVGGDEFVILLIETGPEDAAAAARKVQAEIHGSMDRSGWPITISVGLATFLTPPASVPELLRRVDNLMYSAKRSGKDSIRAEVVREPGAADG
jgi:diguanylate cyclase (GGDEF)-like protein